MGDNIQVPLFLSPEGQVSTHLFIFMLGFTGFTNIYPSDASRVGIYIETVQRFFKPPTEIRKLNLGLKKRYYPDGLNSYLGSIDAKRKTAVFFMHSFKSPEQFSVHRATAFNWADSTFN